MTNPQFYNAAVCEISPLRILGQLTLIVTTQVILLLKSGGSSNFVRTKKTRDE